LSAAVIVLAADFWDTFDIFKPDNWFRQVPEGMEFVGVLLTILGSLGIMVMFGKWWER
jgi:hypothetical protein